LKQARNHKCLPTIDMHLIELLLRSNTGFANNRIGT
jgi:hypothetical protein